jgi:hypothetical protein
MNRPFNPVLATALRLAPRPAPVPVPVPVPVVVALSPYRPAASGFSSAAIARARRNDGRRAPSWRM